MSDFSTRLRFAITNYAAGAISYKSFAGLIDIPYRTLQNYLSGERSPNLEALEKLAANGINIHWLVTGQGTPYTITELERPLLDTVFILHSEDVLKRCFGSQDLYGPRERLRLLSFIMANNYLRVGDVVHGLIEKDESYSDIGELEKALAAGEFDYMFDRRPTNQRELWKAKEVVREKRGRGAMAPFALDKLPSDEVGE